ncbi:MAG: Flp family type IVb pilin [Acidimicrobiales bacterium]
MGNVFLSVWIEARSRVRSRRSDEAGAVASEYALLLFLIAVALIVAIGGLRDGIIAAFDAATAVLP